MQRRSDSTRVEPRPHKQNNSSSMIARRALLYVVVATLKLCVVFSSHRPHTRKSHRSATQRPKPHVQRNTSSTSKPTNWRKKITNQQQTETQKIEQAQQDIEQKQKAPRQPRKRREETLDSLRQETKQMLQQLQDIKAQRQRRDKVGPAPPMGQWAQTVRAEGLSPQPQPAWPTNASECQQPTSKSATPSLNSSSQ
eukprot:g59157.t1